MRVLICEDHHDTRELLQMSLEQAGWEVFTAKDGRDALRVYHNAIENDEFFDVLLIDVAMPRLNGFGVGVNVRNLEKFSDIPRVPRALHVYFTGYDDIVPPEDLLECLFADAYIHKPIVPSELIAQIEELIKRSGDAPE